MTDDQLVLRHDADGGFRLMELEVIEPSLFLNFAPDGGFNGTPAGAPSRAPLF